MKDVFLGGPCRPTPSGAARPQQSGRRSSCSHSPGSLGGTGGAQTHFGMPVGGIFACCVLPGGVLVPAASSHGREPGLGRHMPQRLCRKTGDTPKVRGDSGPGQSPPKESGLKYGLTVPPHSQLVCSAHTGHSLLMYILGLTTISKGIFTEHLICAGTVLVLYAWVNAWKLYNNPSLSSQRRLNTSSSGRADYLFANYLFISFIHISM